MTLSTFLNNPYPSILNKWRTAILVSLFIAFFLGVFQPFGLQSLVIDHKNLILLGYGLVTFLILLVNLFVLPLVFKRFFKEANWRVWKQVTWSAGLILTISSGNYAYSVLASIVPWVGLQGFLVFLLFTVPIAIIPMVVTVFVAQNLYLKKNLSLSAHINKDLEKPIEDTEEEGMLVFNSGAQTYQYSFLSLLYLESEGNYVNVHYLDNGEEKSDLVRQTLKELCAEVEEKVLFKCHRAFVINPQYVEKVEGNSHGISVTLAHTEVSIPVSRNNTKVFTALMKSLQA